MDQCSEMHNSRVQDSGGQSTVMLKHVVVGVAELRACTQLVSIGFRRKHEHVFQYGADWLTHGWIIDWREQDSSGHMYMYSNTGWIGIADQQLNIQSVREEFQRTGIRVLKHGHDGSGRPIQYSARENRIPAETALSYWNKVVVVVADLKSDTRPMSKEFRRKHKHVANVWVIRRADSQWNTRLTRAELQQTHVYVFKHRSDLAGRPATEY